MEFEDFPTADQTYKVAKDRSDQKFKAEIENLYKIISTTANKEKYNTSVYTNVISKQAIEFLKSKGYGIEPQNSIMGRGTDGYIISWFKVG